MIRRVPVERVNRAWLAVFACALAIYAVVPFARSLVGQLKSAGLRWIIEPAVYAVVLGAVFVVAQTFRRVDRTSRNCNWPWLIVVAAGYAVGTWHLRANPEEALHLLEYGALAFVAFRAIAAKAADTGAAFAAALTATAFGIGDEILQWIVPSRLFDFRDMLVNASGGLLMGIALARAVRPNWLGRGCGSASRQAIGRAGMAVCLLLLACVSGTPANVEKLSRLVPPVSRIPEEMIQYGHRLYLADGSVFFSRRTAAELAASDQIDGGRIAALMQNAGIDPAVYAAFLREHSAVSDPVVHEVRVHLFRRDRYLDYARRQRNNESAYRGNLWVALREHRFLETFLPGTTAALGSTFPADRLADALRLGPPAGTYISPVSNQLVTRFTERQLQLVLLVPIVALAGLLVHARRR